MNSAMTTALATVCPTCDGEGKVLSFIHGTVRVIPCPACTAHAQVGAAS